MGIIDKISDKLHGDSSSKNVDHHDTTNQQANRLDERTGTSTSSSTTGTSNTHHTSGTTHSNRDTEVRQTAPVTQERVHDQHIHKDNLHKTDVHEKTHVDQTVQPVYDKETRGTTHERVDHGTELREHGNRGIGREAEAELARNREQIGKEHRNTHDQETFHTSNRTHGGVETRQHNIEEVVPVVERDVYRPHEIQHDKRVVDVHHEPTTVHKTHVNEPISAQEFERTGGHHTGSSSYSTGTTGSTTSTTQGAHGTSDAHASKKHTGIGEKIEHVAEKVTHKDLDHDGDVAGKPVAGSTSTTHHAR